jgi:hypothetical protein
VQVAGHGARGADDYVVRGARVVDRAEHFRLCRQGRVAEVVGALDRRVPLGGQARGVLAVGGIRRPALERPVQHAERFPRVGGDRQARLLRGVERGDVDVDEPRSRERSSRGRGEVAVPGADADDEIGLASERIGGARAGGTHRTDRLRVVVGQGPFARLGFRYRDARGFGERP